MRYDPRRDEELPDSVLDACIALAVVVLILTGCAYAIGRASAPVWPEANQDAPQSTPDLDVETGVRIDFRGAGDAP